MRVLFVCVHNAGRSRMAEALFNARAGRAGRARSAGTAPAAAPHPEVVEAMREIGIGISGPGRLLTQEDVAWADRVISMGCSVEEACPAGWLGEIEDWDLPDPKGRTVEQVRAIRDEIARRVGALLADEGSREGRARTDL